ncbi:MAG: S8 family serine peptidase [Solirubrobacterales bacterium]
MEASDQVEGEPLPAWSLPADREIGLGPPPWPHPVTREWAWGGSTGSGVRVCVVDSGIEIDHPDVGDVDRRMTVSVDPSGLAHAEVDELGDVSGHGTACASIIRRLAPDCELTSMRVLTQGKHGSKGTGLDMVAGLIWAIEERFDVIGLSLSTTRHKYSQMLYEMADRAYFQGAMIVASAHNMPVQSYPWRYAAVVSVGSHEDEDPMTFYCNPTPPVEFFAAGVDIEVAWSEGSRIRATGNSFAAPHVSGILALIRDKHPELSPYELKSVLRLTASNTGEVDA